MTSTVWLPEELEKIGVADDLKISPFRDDGKTYGTPTWIWSVVVGGNLYARPYHGQNSKWYKAAMKQKSGRINVAGLSKEVTFEPVTGAINERIDSAYKTKYQGSPYLDPMIGDRARSATVRINPKNR